MNVYVYDRKKITFTGGLLKKCGVMEALNRHERFILESPIIPPNAYPFVYWKGSSLKKTSWNRGRKMKNNNYVDGLKIALKLRYLSKASAL